VFQELTVLENLTVGRNILIGEEPTRLGGLWLDGRALHAAAQAALDRWDIRLDARAPLAGLSTGQKQMVEIARACAGNPRVLILDEPTSSLGRHEEELLFALIDRLRATGVAIVHITHRMSEVFHLADRITVLRDGRHVVTDATAAFSRDGLIRAMVGRSIEDRRPTAGTDALPVALSLRGLAAPPRVAGVDLDLHRGEVLGLAGLMGAGRTELARLVAGADRPAAGTMTLDGAPFAPRGVGDAVAAGVAYVPEDRKTQGLVQTLSVADNIALPSLRRVRVRGFLSVRRLRALAADWMARLGVKAAGPDVGVTTLSGGNQQKVVLAKWLATEPRVILLDEPTRGVDVGAKGEIHALIRDLAARGAAVLVISSELPEVLTVSDRIAVMAGGRIAGIVPAAGASEESLLALAFDEAGARPAA
jgi:ABC-type sugar transport system ATPase subunit